MVFFAGVTFFAAGFFSVLTAVFFSDFTSAFFSVLAEVFFLGFALAFFSILASGFFSGFTSVFFAFSSCLSFLVSGFVLTEAWSVFISILTTRTEICVAC